MTTERIDHVGEATASLAIVSQRPISSYSLAIAEAQVHATLALVEQQRIANLITLAEPRAIPGGGTASYMLYDPTTRALRDDVREGLGL